MKAIILAAGRGSRMGEGTEEIPKGMMQLQGKPLLEYGLRSLHQAGFDEADIAIVTGYRGDKIQYPGVRYFKNEQWETTNMFVSLTMARPWLQSEDCIVCYSDIVYSPKAVAALMDPQVGDIGITSYSGYWDLWAARFKNPLEDLETFRLNQGELVEIGKRPHHRNQVEGQYMGLLKFSPAGWQTVEQAVQLEMPKPIEKLDMTTLLQHLLNLGNKIDVVNTDDLWLECDNRDDIALYEQLYKDQLQQMNG